MRIQTGRRSRAFNVSLDYLLFEEVSRRPLEPKISTLVAQRVLALQDLSEEDEKSLLHMINAIEAKNKLKALAAQVG